VCDIVVSVVMVSAAMLNVGAPFKDHLANTQQPVSRAITMSFGQKSMRHLIGKYFFKTRLTKCQKANCYRPKDWAPLIVELTIKLLVVLHYFVSY
jgi:hypothetical protein